MKPEPQLQPGAAYWVRTLKPFLAGQVAIGLRSGRVVVGRLVDADAQGPVLVVEGSRRRPCGWQDVQSVESATDSCRAE